MKNRISGSALILLSVILFWLVLDTFVGAWSLLTEMPDWIPAYQYISIIAQAALYLVAFVLSMVFGYSVITAQDKQRMKSKRLAFVAILILMVAFEMPFYPCTNFHPSRHSLWESYRLHFH